MHKLKYFRRITTLALIFHLASTSPSLAVTPPNAGTTLNNLEEQKQQATEKQAPSVQVQGQQENTPETNGPKILVNGIQITGQTIFSEDKLRPLVNDAIGKALSLSEMEEIAGRITKYFRDQGYPVATAYIPAQDLKNGILEITVVVGQYGKIDIRNHSRLMPYIALSLLSSLKSGDYIKQDQLERTLLLVNDTSGLSAKATLAPGMTPGTSDLIIELTDTPKTNGQIYSNNWGNRFTGKNQLSANMNINDISGKGDMVSLGGTYTGSGMNDYSISYLLPTGGQGAKLGVSYSHMHYALGEDFASLDANGLAATTSIFETYSFIRSRDFNLNGRIEYDTKELIDRVDSASSYSQKKANVVIIGVNGDNRDKFAGGGENSFALSYSSGHLSLESGNAVIQDTSAQTAGEYGKTNLALNRIQAIDSRLNLYLAFTGQLADKNLDSSEKLSIGGPNAVRAYPPGEAPSDEGYIFTSELRWNLPTPSFQLAVFYDNGKAIINKNPWPDAGVNNRILAGAGLGLIWNRAADYVIRLDYAWKITTDAPATSDTDKNGRIWLQGIKYF